MARNRQRAKERKQRERDPAVVPPDDGADEIVHPSLAAGGAPPTDLGRVQAVDADDDDSELVPGELSSEADAAAADGPQRTAEPRPRGASRVAGFLRASWAELQRVQWPDRRQVGQGTAVVLGFVIVAGAFLGFADFVAQRIVELIL